MIWQLFFKCVDMRTIKTIVFLTCVFVFSIATQAQSTPVADSLQKILPTLQGKSRIDLLNELGWELKFNNPKQAIEYTNEALKLAESLTYYEGMALAHRNLGAVFIIQGRPAEGGPDIDKASEFIEKTSNSFQKAKIKNLKAIILRETHMYRESIFVQKEALEIFRSLNDTAEITGNLHNLAILYQRLLDEDQALKLYLEVYDIEIKRQNHFGISRTANNLGGIYDRMGKFDKAIQLYKTSVASSQVIGNRQFESAAYHQLGNIYLNSYAADSAIFYYEKAAAINKELGFLNYLGNNLFQMGEAYRQSGKSNEAILKYLGSAEVFRNNQDQRSLANALNQLALINIGLKDFETANKFASEALNEYTHLPADETLANIYTNYYKISKEKRRYKESLGFLEKAVNLRDSLSKVARDKELDEIETRYEVRKIEDENSKLLADNEQKTRAIRIQQLVTLVLVILVLVILVTIYFVSRGKRQLRNLNLQLINQSRELEEKAGELESANATKDKLFSIIAHDIRNPFSAVLNFSELLLEEVEQIDNPALKMYADNIYLSSQNTFVLLENLLYWSKSQRGAITLQPSKVNLNQMVLEVLKTAKANAIESNVVLKMNLPENIFLHTDSTLLRIILGNLTGNAIRYNKPGGSVEIVAENADNEAHIKVIDTGIGMEQNRIKQIIEGKGNVPAPEKSKKEGTGLGLILCVDFVKRLGSELSIESTPGEGSIFSFTVPLAEKEE